MLAEQDFRLWTPAAPTAWTGGDGEEVTPVLKRPRWLHKLHRSQKCPDCGAAVKETYCEVCGYDLVRKVQDDVSSHRPTF